MDRLTLTVEETAKLLGIGRNVAYEMVAQGKLPALRLGKRIVISRAGLERMLAAAGGDKGKGGEQNNLCNNHGR
ncbi:MAG: helix-turn-helix domain-containing protein [Dehalococcoidia bacterium]|nr:helix-turn-helix domain-containing protein [Dehalococcoidia bacterium]